MFELGKRGISRAVRSGAFSRFVSLLERVDDGRTNLLRVLMYHRVDYPAARPDLYPPLLSATPAGFERQMRFLAERCHVVSLDELLQVCRSGGVLPARSVMITFDDAYRDFSEHAWPVLRRRGLPVTLFVPTAFPDQPGRAFWWDRLHRAVNNADGRDRLETWCGSFPLASEADRRTTLRQLTRRVKSLPHLEGQAFVEEIWRSTGAPQSSNCVLGWDELRRLAGEGVTLAPHTRTHPLMNRISLEQARDEAVGSLDDLRQKVGDAPPVLAYPAGGFNPDLATMLRDEGFEVAVTTIRGINDLNTANPLRLRRIAIGMRTTEAALRAQLMPCLARFRSWLN